MTERLENRMKKREELEEAEYQMHVALEEKQREADAAIEAPEEVEMDEDERIAARKAAKLEDLKALVDEIKNDTDEEDQELIERMRAMDVDDEEQLEKLLEEVELFETDN